MRAGVASTAVLLAIVAGCSGNELSRPPTAPTTSAPIPTAPTTVSSSASPSSATTTPAAEPVDDLDELLENWAADHEVVGAVALVAHGDTIATAAVGERVLGAGQPIEPDDRFPIGSITKTFAAALTLQLADSAELSLSDEVGLLLPGAADGVTIEDLLGHTSGYRDGDIGSALMTAIFEPESRRTADDQIADIVAGGTATAPGARQRYASVNYVVLGGVIEAATGSSFEDELHSWILDALDLSATGFVPTAAAPSLHERPGPGQPPIDLAPFDVGDVVRSSGASGALISTSTDLLTFTRALFEGRVIPDDRLRQMIATEAPRVDYGLGISVDTSPTGTTYGHDGRTIGAASSLRHDDERDITVIVLSNDGGAPTDRLADALLDLRR